MARSTAIAVSIQPTTLAVAIPILAQQCGCDIVSTEPNLRSVSVRAIQGIMPIGIALRRLVAGTGYRAVAIDGTSYRIVANPRSETPRVTQARRSTFHEDIGDILVTASKQSIPLLRFPGTIVTVSNLAQRGSAVSVPNLDEIARLNPILQNTELGDGRNKTFIRGIADSSFNGATQSTASTYFGDVQLGYSGPGPGLRLHDVRSVEVMEGPQGTLYGAGSIGGIIRITPNPVVLGQTEGAATAGVSTTVSGTIGYDLSGMINVPMIDDRLGVRVVGYRQRTGGYIDGRGPGRENLNGANITGGRVEVRADLSNGWEVTTGGLRQTISADGAQYADRFAGPLNQFATVPQPFSNAITLGRVVLSKRWDSGLQFTSATGAVQIHSTDVYDATGSPGTIGRAIYDDGRNDLLISQEARLSRSLANGASWLTGFTMVYDRNEESRAMGMIDAPADIIGVTNVTKTISAFAEATLPITPNLSFTVGGRATRARTDGEPSIDAPQSNFVHGRSTLRFDPTLAASWLLAPRVALYGRYQSGFRTGGIAVARGIGRVADFTSDSIRMGEMGLRIERRSETGVAVSTAVSYARWNDIQADLINRRGQPYTANIGNAEIYAFEGKVDWVPVVGLHTGVAFLYTYNRVDGTVAQSSAPVNRRLPDTPPFAANIEIGYRWSGGSQSEYRIAATGRYVGRSVLGSGNLLDVSQGQYGVIDMTGGWRVGKMDVSLSIENLTNARANRFSFGNPFTFALRDQTTPLQPLTFRVGIAVSF
ncbi:TonB-dependent receptor [Sphingomonas paeninsulae]|nr:TonB-dependent receptor [Sphingomonas paeninsulae]